MPRYFFDLMDGSAAKPDSEGIVLPDVRAGLDEASETLVGMARDHISSDGPLRTMSIVVREESGGRLLTVSVSYTEEPVH
jgi:hypothetical protein